MMSMRSSRSTGTPWGASTSVPRIVHTPRFVAKITIGLRLDSSALPRNDQQERGVGKVVESR